MKQVDFDLEAKRLCGIAQRYSDAGAFCQGMQALIQGIIPAVAAGRLSRRLTRGRVLAVKAMIEANRVAVQLDLYDQYQKAIDRLKGEKDNGQAS